MTGTGPDAADIPDDPNGALAELPRPWLAPDLDPGKPVKARPATWRHAGPRTRVAALTWFRRGALLVGILALFGSVTAFVIAGSLDSDTAQPLDHRAPVIDYGSAPTGSTGLDPLAASAPTPGSTTAPGIVDPATTGPPAPTSAGGGPAPTGPAPKAPTPIPTRTTPAPATFAALSGESCPQTVSAGYYRSGWASDWYGGSGGWTADGCAGDSVHVPMSGSTTADDLDNVIVWWFKTGPVTHGNCAVSVYVPNTGTTLDDDGDPATYFVFGSTSVSGSPMATLTVNQPKNQGRWVTAGTVTTTGQLAIRMMTRGIDFGTGRDGAHLGVSALRVACQAT
jgi:hypothetical protein